MVCARCGKETRGKFCFICSLANTHGISKITPNIYLTDNINSRDYVKLQRMGVQQILTVGIDLEPHATDIFRTYKVDVSDVENENIGMYFNATNDFINKGITLVHCRAGISRSASIVIAYLMKIRKWSLNRAMSYVKSRRRIIKPNPGFLLQLKSYESTLLKKKPV